MTVNNNTPDIRFNVFSGDWIEKKIERVLTEENRNITLIDDESYELVTVKRRNQGVVSRGFLNGKDILVKNYFKVRAGDFLISKRQVIHGANGIVPSCLDKAIVSNEYLVIGDNEEIKTEFWALIARMPQMYEKFFLSSYGVDIEKMVFDVFDWKTRDVVIPGIDEQTAISDFFKYIDQNIALSRRKYEKTNMLKNAFLSKMFPQTGKNKPEIRLKGFSGDWVEKMLVDEVDFFTGLTYSPSNVTDKMGTLVLRSSNVQGGEISLKDNVYVSSEVVNSQNIELGDIIVVVRNGSRNLIGKHAMIKKPMANTVIGAFMTGIRAPVSSFLNALLDTQQFSDEVSKNLGATINQITGGMFKNMKFYFPQEEEQTAIGQFFKQMDDTLALQAKQLEALETLKKALLAKMFV